MLDRLREHGRVRIYPHARAIGDQLVADGVAVWGEPAETLRGGTYGWWLLSTEGRWVREACPCCGASRLVPAEGA